MKMLFAADVNPDVNSGASGTDVQTIEALRLLGHHVDTIWARDLRHVIKHGNLHYLLELPRAYRDAIEARCRSVDYDVIHVDQPHAWLAALDHRRRSRPGVFVNRSHGWEPNVEASLELWRRCYHVPQWHFPRGAIGRPLRWMLNGLYPWWVLRHSDGVIVSSSCDRNFILRHEHVDPARVACIPQAPAKVFHAVPVQPMTAGRLKRVLYVGQHAFVKGPPVIASIMSRLASEVPGVCLTWCCAESAHDEVRRALPDSIRGAVQLKPWMPQEQLVRLYDEHGVFIFPSFYEGFGKAFIEAMSRGLVVVASDTGGMHDVIRDGQNGRLVPVGDVDGFVKAVCAGMADIDASSVMGSAAAEVASIYTWERVALEMVAFCKQLQAR